MAIVAFFVFVAVFALLTALFGADSRDGNDWVTHRPL